MREMREDVRLDDHLPLWILILGARSRLVPSPDSVRISSFIPSFNRPLQCSSAHCSWRSFGCVCFKRKDRRHWESDRNKSQKGREGISSHASLSLGSISCLRRFPASLQSEHYAVIDVWRPVHSRAKLRMVHQSGTDINHEGNDTQLALSPSPFPICQLLVHLGLHSLLFPVLLFLLSIPRQLQLIIFSMHKILFFSLSRFLSTPHLYSPSFLSGPDDNKWSLYTW